MRKLASIQTITSLTPIPGADAIECARILGWDVVVKKGDFQVGDPCVYVEIDSILPDKPEFEFMKPRGMRVRTVRLRGQVSQGIAFPLTILGGATPETDADVTETVGIIKYEPVVPTYLSGEAKGPFPQFIPKTDETRVQILQRLLEMTSWPCR